MRAGSLLVLLLVAGPLLGAGRPPGGTSRIQQDLAYVEERTAYRPFLETCPDLKTDPQTIGSFFNRAVYAKLMGNPWFGYYYNEGYRPTGEGTIQVPVLQTRKGLERYRNALQLAICAAATRCHRRLGKSGQSIGLSLVGIGKDPHSRLKGVVIEAYCKNEKTGKALFMRFTYSQESLEAAFMKAAELVLRASLEGRWKTR